MTNDVESFSIPLNRCDEETAQQVYKVGLPRILDLYSKHDITSTFYFTGEIVEIVPEAIDLVKDHGHEIGCHGYSHEIDRAFDILSCEEQVNELKKAKKIIESVAGRIESFRAPALRINEDTANALEKTGFTSDSSICPQRFDGPFTFGSRRKLRWLIAPRGPHFICNGSSILEIPISSFLFPYIGTIMRISPSLTRIIEKLLFFESKQTGKPIVFLFHPNECLDFSNCVPTRRTNSYIQHLFADKLRQKMKLKNLGINSINLLEKIIKETKNYEFEFKKVREYTKSWRESK